MRASMRLRVPIDVVFAFFADAANLERITPPELGFTTLTPSPFTIRQGSLIDYRLSLFGVGFKWKTEITEWNPPHEFVDTQLSGPYAQWIHRHRFYEENGETVIEDEVRYRLPVPVIGVLAWPLVRLQIERIFRYRQKRIGELIAGG